MTFDKDAFRRAREREMLTQEELADELDVTQESIHQWETGKAEPSLPNQIEVERWLDDIEWTPVSERV